MVYGTQAGKEWIVVRIVAVEGADLQCICEQFVEMNAKVDDGWLDCEGGLDSAANT